MKSSISLLLLFTIFTSTSSCQEKRPYDNSTPEKMLSSLTLISQQPKELNPIPFFYRKNDAKAIMGFDAAGEKALSAFEGFKEALQVSFPDKIKRVSKNKIELQSEENSFFTESFTLSASLIKQQLQEQKPEAYEFISASEPNEKGIVMVDYKMLGKTQTLEVVKEDGHYVMSMTADNLEKLKQMTSFFSKAERIFSNFTKDIEQKTITYANFKEQTGTWSTQYIDLVNSLN